MAARARLLLLLLACACSEETVALGVASAPDAGTGTDAGAAATPAPTPDAGAATHADAASTPASEVTRYPLVLAHGWSASPGFLGFEVIAEDLRARGYTVVVTRVPPYDAVEVRGAELARQIDDALRDTGAAKVNVVAHSMGGLDARHAISGLGYGDRVASLSTIATPHGGSAIADVALGLTPGAADAAADALARAFGAAIGQLGADAHMRASLVSLSEANAAAFDAAHPDDPRVVYQSWAGLSNAFAIPGPDDADACEGRFLFDPRVRDVLDPLLAPIAAVVAHGPRLFANDGLVRVTSAKHGRFRGCLATDHFDEMGGVDGRRPADPITGFDALPFFRALAAELAAAGL